MDNLTADGFDKAIIGRCSRTFNYIYSSNMCIEILMVDSEMEYEEACEYFYFNVADAYVGEGTPIFMDTVEVE